MSPDQRKKYFRLWPAACKVQGWNPKDEGKRREVTQAATGQTSSKGLSQGQISRLFDYLAWLTDPLNLDKAILAANPDVSEDANQRRQLVHVIRQTAAKAGLNDAYLTATAAGKCRVHHCQTWDALPLPALRQFAMTITARARKRPATPLQPVCTAPDDIPWLDGPEDPADCPQEAEMALPADKCPF